MAKIFCKDFRTACPVDLVHQFDLCHMDCNKCAKVLFDRGCFYCGGVDLTVDAHLFTPSVTLDDVGLCNNTDEYEPFIVPSDYGIQDS